MKWPWSKQSKNINPDTQQEILESGSEPTVDDWEESCGEWSKRIECHCGQRKVVPMGGSVWSAGFRQEYDVCPKCGHEDKWETFIGKTVCEYSPARHTYWVDKCHEYTRLDKYQRNEHTVRWTPEDCPVKEI